MKKYLPLFALASLAPLSAMAADELSYSWVEFDYVNLDIENVGDSNNILGHLDNGGGWGVRGSFGFAENMFVFGNYSDTEADANFIDSDGNISVDAETDIHKLDVGLGYHMSIDSMSDAVFRAAYIDVDRDHFRFGASGDSSLDDLNDDKSDGYFIDAAYRRQLTNRVEGGIGVRYTDIQDVDGGSIFGNVLFELSPEVGFNLGADVGSEMTTWRIGFRYSF